MNCIAFVVEDLGSLIGEKKLIWYIWISQRRSTPFANIREVLSMLLNWLNDYLSKRRRRVVGCYIRTPRICVNDLSDAVKHGTVNSAVL